MLSGVRKDPPNHTLVDKEVDFECFINTVATMLTIYIRYTESRALRFSSVNDLVTRPKLGVWTAPVSVKRVFCKLVVKMAAEPSLAQRACVGARLCLVGHCKASLENLARGTAPIR